MNKKILIFGMIMMFTVMLVTAGSGDYVEEPEEEVQVQQTRSGGNSRNRITEQRYVDDIKDIRKELLLKQLIEKQESEQVTEEVITYEKTEIEEVTVNEPEEPKSKKGLTIGIVAVIALLLLFSVWLYNQKTEEE